MDVADILLDKIFCFVNLQEKCAHELNKLAKEMEAHIRHVNISQVAGSSASVGGAAAMTVAGVAAICTAGAALPILSVAGTVGAVISGLGAATSVGSGVVGVVISSCTMKEAEEISEKIQNLEKGIQKLMESLKEEGKRREQQAGSCSDVSPEDCVVERILRAMAKRSGLVFNDKINLYNMMSAFSKRKIPWKDTAFSLLGESLLGLAVLSKFVIEAVAKKSGKIIISKGFTKMATSMGSKAAAKAVGRVGGGAVGLLVSVPELIIDIQNLIKDDRRTEASQYLRESAKALQTASKDMKQELHKIEKVFQRLSRVQSSVENTSRSFDDKKTLIEFAIENCEDEDVKRWLREKSKSDTFFQLVDMFHFLKKHIDEEEKKDHSNSVDIIFVAHGCIKDSVIPASCLLPLHSITDVILYSPWNCVISVDAAYGVATGRMKPQHRKFYRRDTNCLHNRHELTNLPDHWNSMKKAGDQKIPNIMLSPLEPPKDKAWERFVVLQNTYGQPGRNRIVVPFILPGKRSASSESVPFFTVTLALSLVLLFSRFEATVHLTACLGDKSAEEKFDQEYLKQQYACTVNTGMTCSLDIMSVNLKLREILKNVFD